MAIFITQGNYSESAIKGMVDNPEDRKAAVAGLMESVGAKLVDYYVTTGNYDFLVISGAVDPSGNDGCRSYRGCYQSHNHPGTDHPGSEGGDGES